MCTETVPAYEEAEEAFSTKWLQPSVFGYKNGSIYTFILNQYRKLQK